MANIKVSIVNQSSVVSDKDAAAVVDALQIQVHRDFAPIWGIDADLVYIAKGQTADPKTWCLLILDNSDVDGALGYHDLNKSGVPVGKIFAKTDLDNHLLWSVTASHELLEMLADPEINLTSFVQTTRNTGIMYAFEMCDAVEDDQYAYDINGVKVSDFILPSYFQHDIPATKWDFCGHLKGGVPNMLSGGYLSKFVVGKTTSGWTQITAQKLSEGVEVPSRATRQLPSSRRKKRATTGLDVVEITD